MTLFENAAAGTSWAVVALIQVTLLTLVVFLAWLLARRGGPALRGAVLLAGLVALLLTPLLALLAPVWLPLPEWVCPVDNAAAPTDADRATTPTQVARSDEIIRPAPEVVFVPQPTLPSPVVFEDPANQTAKGADAKKKPGTVVINLPAQPELAQEQETSAAPVPEPTNAWGVVAGTLALVWLFGTLLCLSRALVRLGLLYRCARRARPVTDPQWVQCVASLARQLGLPAVELRESPDLPSPLTLGLSRPVILLPLSRYDWSDEERELILGHELAHVRRRDFLAGLIAELVLCLCWFHPLVRWQAGRLRLEQEYAADAWAASATCDAGGYVRCLARLALGHGRGRGSLAPALWRRRPEILRRIDMLRNNPAGVPSRLGNRTAWVVAVLAALVCLAVAGVGPLRSTADDSKTNTDSPKAESKEADPLPEGAVARLGTTRLRHGADVTFVAYGPGGKTLITAGQDGTIRLWDLADRKEVRRFSRPRPAPVKDPKKEEPKDAAEAFMMAMAGADGPGSAGLAVSPDGKILAGGAGGVIQLWDVQTGKPLRQLEGAPGGLAGLAFSADGKTLAVRGSGGGLHLWSTSDGKKLHAIMPARRRNEDGIVLVLGGGGGGGDPLGITFTPDGKALVGASIDYEKDQPIHSIKFWDVTTGKEIRKFTPPGGAGATATGLAFAPGGQVLACAIGNTIHLCEADTGKSIRAIKPGDGAVRGMAFAPDGKTLAVRGRNQRVRLFSTETGKELHRLNDAEPPQQNGGGGLVFVVGGHAAPEERALAVSPDGKQVASASGSTIRIWDATTGKELPLTEGHRRSPAMVLMSADGKTAVTWGLDRVVRRWEVATGKPLGAFAAPAGTNLAALSPDGRSVALANADNTVRFHDTATGKELRRLKGHPGGTSALAFAPGGKVLASRGGDNTIRLHDVASGAELKQIVIRPTRQATEDGTVASALLFLGGGRTTRGTGPGLAFSPDGRLIVLPVGNGGERSNTLVFFDSVTGKELRKIDSPQPIASYAISPDGRTLAAEHSDRTVTLWEVATGKERGRLGKAPADKQQQGGGEMALMVDLDGVAPGPSGPGGPVGIAYSPDGRALVVRGPDRSVHVWDVAVGKELGQLRGHEGRVDTVAFSPDGRRLVSGSSDTTVLVWDAAGPLKGLTRQRETQLSPTEVRGLWDDLAGDDATKAMRAVRGLVSAHGQSVPFLAERLKPAVRIDAKKIDGWIADLESDKFAVRQEAAINLIKVGEQALPALQKVLAAGPMLETRKRLEDLVNRLSGGTLTTEQLRLVRAVEALELIGTPEARKVLQSLAGGAPGTLPTREARAALERIKESR